MDVAMVALMAEGELRYGEKKVWREPNIDDRDAEARRRLAQIREFLRDREVQP